jgi:hypothetical protein
MDIVYICRSGYNEELKYSIRSVVKNVPHDKIWVVGQKPEWYTGNFIPVRDKGSKYKNARENLKKICASEEISKDFILMNDDFFVMKKIDKIDYFYSSSLEERADLNFMIAPNAIYTKLLNNTVDRLNEMGIKEPKSYELHVPMIMNRQNLKSLLSYKNTLWRSMYGNIFHVGGKKMEDVKVYPASSSRENSFDWENKLDKYLSSQDDSFPELKSKLLGKKFTKKSPYEA